MKVKVVRGNLHQFLLFASRHRLLRQTIGIAPARLHLHKDKIVRIFRDKINLAIGTAKIALQDTISLLLQSLCRQPLACAPQSLPGRFYTSLTIRSVQLSFMQYLR